MANLSVGSVPPGQGDGRPVSRPVREAVTVPTERYVPFDPAQHPLQPGVSGPDVYPRPASPKDEPYTMMPVAVPTKALAVDTETGTVGVAPWMQLVDSTQVYTMTPEQKIDWERGILPAGSQAKPNTSKETAALTQLTMNGVSLASGLGNLAIAARVLGVHTSVGLSAAGPMAMIGGAMSLMQTRQQWTDALDMRRQLQAVEADVARRTEAFQHDHAGEPLPDSLQHPTVAMPARMQNGRNIEARDEVGTPISVQQPVPLEQARRLNRNQFLTAAASTTRSSLIVAAGLTLNPWVAAAAMGIGLGSAVFQLAPVVKSLVQQMKAANVDASTFKTVLKALPKLPGAVYRAWTEKHRQKPEAGEAPEAPEPAVLPAAPKPAAEPVPPDQMVRLVEIPAGRQVVNPTLQYQATMALVQQDVQLTLHAVATHRRAFAGSKGEQALSELLAQHPGAAYVHQFAAQAGKSVAVGSSENVDRFLSTMTEYSQKLPGVPTAVVQAIVQRQQAQQPPVG